MKSFALDSKFKAIDVTVRGFVYVMKDLTHRCVETAAFLPGFVTLDNPLQFMYSRRMLADGASLSALQDLYRLRKDIYRVVYCVSCSHSSMEQLATDLNQYGVLQRGYTTTPSELIEVMCFERPQGWLERNKKTVSVPDPIIKGLVGAAADGSSTQSGIVVSANNTRRGWKYRIALDFSNDVVIVGEDSIVRVISSYQSKASDRDADAGEVPVGANVQVQIAGTKNMSLSSKPMQLTADPQAGEVLLVSIKILGAGRAGVDKSAIVPLMVGRSSFPVPAKALDTAVTESLRSQLSTSYTASAHAATGRLGCATFLNRGFRRAWAPAVRLHRGRVLENLSAPGAEVHERSYFDLVTAIGSDDLAIMHSSLDLLLSLACQKVSMSHPMVQWLNHNLGGMGAGLIMAQTGDNSDQWKQHLDEMQTQQCLRLGVSAEELYVLGARAGLFQSDIEAFCHRVSTLKQPARPNYNYNHNHDGVQSGSGASALGPVDAGTLGVLYSTSPISLGGGTSEALLHGRAEDGKVRALLVQHSLLLATSLHTQALRGVANDAQRTLQALLTLLVQPLLVSVKDSTYLLPLPSKADVQKGYPARIEAAPGGQYGIFTKMLLPTQTIPGVKMSQIRASRARPADGVQRSFMTWRYNSKEDDIPSELMAAVNRVQQVMQPIQRDIPCVRVLDGITYTAEIDSSGLNFEWNDSWCTLESITQQHGGLLQRGKFELLRLLGTRLLDTVTDFNDRNIGLRSLSPHTIILDETGMCIRLMVLPTISELDDPESELNASANDLLSQYAASSTTANDPVLTACLPNFGRDVAVDMNGPGAAAFDVWSYGMCLFIMAFGPNPLTVHSIASQSNSNSGNDGNKGALDQALSESTPMEAVAADILHRLLHPLMQQQAANQSQGAEDSLATSARGSGPLAEGLAVAQSLQSLLDEKSRGLVFSLVEQLTESSLTRLSQWRASFLAEAPTCGLTEQSAGALFERLAQNIFYVLRGGQGSSAAVRSLLSGAGADFSPDSAKSFAHDHLAVVLTKAEFESFITSLAPTLRKKPYAERAQKGFKALAGLLQELLCYGMFQQLLYIVSRCLNPDPRLRPQLHEIRRMPFFGVTDEVSLSKAAQEARLLLTPYQSPREFFEKALRMPLQTALQSVLDASDGRPELARDTHSDLEAVSSALGCLEELGSLLNLLADRSTAAGSGTRSDEMQTQEERFPFILSTGAEFHWVCSHVREIVQECVHGKLFPAVALFTARFLNSDNASGTEDSKALRSTNGRTGGGNTGNTGNTKGLSLGARLIVRVAKFFQHFVSCLQHVSRPLAMSHIVTTDANNRSGLLGEEAMGLTQTRASAEALYKGVLSAMTMLYLGEESCLPLSGSFAKKVRSSHPHVLASADEKRTNSHSQSNWSVNMSKLMEPLILDMVGDDGKGSGKMTLGGDVLRQADVFVPLLHTLVAKGGDNTHNHKMGNNNNNNNNNSNNNNDTDPFKLGGGFCTGIESRGTSYFVSVMRINRNLCSVDTATGKALDRARTSVVSALNTLLPTVVLPTTKEAEEASNHTLSSVTSALVLDSSAIQRLQVVLDMKLASKLGSYFNTQDTGLKNTLVRVGLRALTICCQVPAEQRAREPFRSLGVEFSSPVWVQALSEVLRGRVINLETTLAAAQCFRAMSNVRNWMRAWPTFDVLSVLLHVHRAGGSHAADLRTLIWEYVGFRVILYVVVCCMLYV